MELFHYLAEDGKDIVREWLARLVDQRARAKINARFDRLRADNFGDCKPLSDGVWELRIDWGPGYRVYYARIGQMVLLLLCGGDKRSQAADIARAIEYFKDYKRRTKDEG